MEHEETRTNKVAIYKNDVVLTKKAGVNFHNPTNTPNYRGEVYEFSNKSRRRLAFVAANTDVRFTIMLTLTYPSEYPSNGKEVKKHLNTFLTWLRSKGATSYLWWLEWQRRGAPHFHILLNTRIDKDEISAHWYKVVGSDDERHLQAGTRIETIRKADGGARYAVKYAMKMYQKVVPVGYTNVGRMWGHSRDVKPKVRKQLTVSDLELHHILKNWDKYQDMIEAVLQSGEPWFTHWSVLFGASEQINHGLIEYLESVIVDK